MLKNGWGRLPAYLALTHAGTAAVVAAAAFWAAGRGWSPGWPVIGGAVLGGLLGLALTGALRAGVEAAGAALRQLADGLSVAMLPPQGRSLLPDLFAGIESLAERERGWASGQVAALRQAEETAAQNERNRLARDLHDSIKQQLFSINASAATALARWTGDPEGAKAALADVRQSAREANAEMQALLQQLRPMPLDRVGLVDALREQCEALSYRTGAKVTTEFGELPGEERLPPGAQEALFRIAQEALSNIARHARAGNVEVRLHKVGAGPALRLAISDDGQGFDSSAQLQGMGIDNMQERAQRIGATCAVSSTPGEGTTVTVHLPLTVKTATEKEETMNASIQATIKQGVRAHYGLWTGIGLALFMVLSTIPVIVRTMQGGPQFPGFQILIPGGIALAGLVVAGSSYSRLRRARRDVLMTTGPHSPAALRLSREIEGHQMWFLLTAVVVLPLALLRQRYADLPTPAVITGATFAVLALLQVLQQRRTTEALFGSLGPADVKVEVKQAWSQRYNFTVALLIAVPAYIVLLVLEGDPIGTWFSLPPGRGQAINLVVTFYLLVLGAWAVVNYRLVRKWHASVEA